MKIRNDKNIASARYVYLVNDASDVTAMGGTSNNVYITAQAAYDAANSIQTAFGGSNKVVIRVGSTTSAVVGNIALTANWNVNVILEGVNKSSSVIGNISGNRAGAGNAFTVNLTATNITIGNITAVPQTSGNGADVTIDLTDSTAGNIDTTSAFGAAGAFTYSGKTSTVGTITTSTSGSGTTGGNTTISGDANTFGAIVTGANNGTSGSVTSTGTHTFSTITTTNLGTGSAGAVTLTATNNSCSCGNIVANGLGSGNGGFVTLKNFIVNGNITANSGTTGSSASGEINISYCTVTGTITQVNQVGTGGNFTQSNSVANNIVRTNNSTANQLGNFIINEKSVVKGNITFTLGNGAATAGSIVINDSLVIGNFVYTTGTGTCSGNSTILFTNANFSQTVTLTNTTTSGVFGSIQFITTKILGDLHYTQNANGSASISIQDLYIAGNWTSTYTDSAVAGNITATPVTVVGFKIDGNVTITGTAAGIISNTMSFTSMKMGASSTFTATFDVLSNGFALSFSDCQMPSPGNHLITANSSVQAGGFSWTIVDTTINGNIQLMSGTTGFTGELSFPLDLSGSTIATLNIDGFTNPAPGATLSSSANIINTSNIYNLGFLMDASVVSTFAIYVSGNVNMSISTSLAGYDLTVILDECNLSTLAPAANTYSTFFTNSTVNNHAPGVTTSWIETVRNSKVSYITFPIYATFDVVNSTLTGTLEKVGTGSKFLNCIMADILDIESDNVSFTNSKLVAIASSSGDRSVQFNGSTFVLTGGIDASISIYTIQGPYPKLVLRSIANLSNSTTETSIYGTTFRGHKRIGGNIFGSGNGIAASGYQYRIKGSGYYSTKATTPGNLTIRLKIGTTTIASGVLALTGGLSNQYIEFDLPMTVVNVGTPSAINVRSSSKVGYQIATVALNALAIVTTADGSFDNTVKHDLDVTAQFSVADTNNTLKLINGSIEEFYQPQDSF